MLKCSHIILNKRSLIGYPERVSRGFIVVKYNLEMSDLKQHLEVIKSSILKDKLKLLSKDLDGNNAIRLHRAISWVKCAEDHTDNPDLKFITLWIAFNACYADNDAHEYVLSEKKRFKDFICTLVNYDVEDRFFKLLWYKFSGPVRLLIDNKYAYKQFWDAQRGQFIEWERLSI